MYSDDWHTFWKELWPEALGNIIRGFMDAGDAGRMAGICSLAVGYRSSTDYEAAVAALVGQTLEGLKEADEIRRNLAQYGTRLKKLGVYEIPERKMRLLQQGLVPSARVAYEVQGYRKTAKEIYLELRDAGFLKMDKYRLGRSTTTWIGLNARWGSLIKDIIGKGKSEKIWASSAGIMICMAIRHKGMTTIKPLYHGILAADAKNGEIPCGEFFEHSYAKVPQGKKRFDIIRGRAKERVEPLNPFPHDDGKRIIVNPNTRYAVVRWQREHIRLARRRGLR